MIPNVGTLSYIYLSLSHTLPQFHCLFRTITKEGFEKVIQDYGLSRNFEKNLQLITEIFGYFIVWMYHMVMIVLLLNLLIAMMSQSYSDIQSNADLGECDGK